MLSLKTRLLESAILERLGLTQLIEKKLGQLRRALNLREPSSPPRPAPFYKAEVNVQETRIERAVETLPAPISEPGEATSAASPVESPAMATPEAEAKPAAEDVESPDTLAQLMAVLAQHPNKDALVKAGQQKDQLLRSLIPLYLAQNTKLEITSGVISRFWGDHGVKYAAPNAAKALRMHVGFAKDGKHGKQITPKGVKYVEDALQATT